VGDEVEVARHHDAVQDLVGKRSAKGFRSASDKITEEIPHPGGIGGGGENEMREEVDAGSFPCVGSQSKGGSGRWL